MRKQLLCLVLTLCLLVSFGFSVCAEPTATEAEPTATAAETEPTAVNAQAAEAANISSVMPTSAFAAYTYDCWGNTIQCPDPYSLIRKVDGVALGTGDFKNVEDIYSKAGYVYLSVNGSDEGDNALIRMDENLNLINRWTGYSDKGKTVNFEKIHGIFVTDEGMIYVAEEAKETRNIYAFSVKGEDKAATLTLEKTIARPKLEDSPIINPDFVQRYIPDKLVVDRTDRVYVVAQNVNEGIVTFNKEGKFDGFLAAGKVTIDPFTKFMKKYVYTDEQKRRIQTATPVEYNNIDLDAEGFIFSTLNPDDKQKTTILSEIKGKKGSEQGALVRRLNMMGTDILKRDGYMPPVGDADIVDVMVNKDAGDYEGLSEIKDVSCGQYGTYAILDNNRKHIFVYNFEGYLLYAFSGPDTSAGGIETPIALAQSNEFLYVLDKDSRSIFMFKETDFAKSVMNAIRLEKAGKYSEAEKNWGEVLKYDATYDLAYLGLGKTAYWKGDYEKASELFEKCNNKTWYSKSWAELRKDVLAKWFMPIVLSIMGIIVLVFVVKIVKKKKAKKEAAG